MNDKKDFVQQSPFKGQQAGSQAESQTPRESIVVPVIEEQLHIGKEIIETGRVRISKSVSEEEELVNIPLNHDEIEVEHVSINQYIETLPPAVRYEGETMIIPVLREVIEKRLLLVEELRVTKRQVQTQTTQPILLRKEEVRVERTATDYEASKAVE